MLQFLEKLSISIEPIVLLLNPWTKWRAYSVTWNYFSSKQACSGLSHSGSFYCLFFWNCFSLKTLPQACLTNQFTSNQFICNRPIQSQLETACASGVNSWVWASLINSRIASFRCKSKMRCGTANPVLPKLSVSPSIVSVWDSMDYVALQAPLSMEFSRQKYWSRLPFPSPGDLPNAGLEPGSPARWGDSLLSEPPGKP